MRIGIDARTILNPGKGEQAGVGHYTYYLIKHLLKNDKKNTYVLFFDSRVNHSKEFSQRNVEIKYFPFYRYRVLLPITYSHLLVSAIVSREKLDVFHSPASTMPLIYQKSSVVTIHDLAIYKNKNWFPGGQQFSTRIVVPHTLKKVDKIIAVSESTKKDIARLFKIPKEKVEVIYNGIDDIAAEKHVASKTRLQSKYGIRDAFILFLGTLEPRKNIPRLIQAFKRVSSRSRFQNIQLVIAGGHGWESKNLAAMCDKLGLSNDVIFTGYVSRSSKIGLMRHAEAFVFPSLYEGFGLSNLEAMALGTPVVTSDTASMPEVMGDAAVYINPKSVKSISDGIIKILSSPKLRKSLTQKGKRQSTKFHWDICAKQTLDIYGGVYRAAKLTEKAEKNRKNSTFRKKKDHKLERI